MRETISGTPPSDVDYVQSVSSAASLVDEVDSHPLSGERGELAFEPFVLVGERFDLFLVVLDVLADGVGGWFRWG